MTGLAGHAFESWRSRVTHQMWLQDMLPLDIQNVRIMSYGYDSSLVGQTKAGNKLLDYKRHFIQQLENARGLVLVCVKNGIQPNRYIALLTVSFKENPPDHIHWA